MENLIILYMNLNNRRYNVITDKKFIFSLIKKEEEHL